MNWESGKLYPGQLLPIQIARLPGKSLLGLRDRPSAFRHAGSRPSLREFSGKPRTKGLEKLPCCLFGNAVLTEAVKLSDQGKLENLQAKAFSSAVSSLLDCISAGSSTAARIPKRIVTSPSSINIHRQPAKPPTPSILIIAVASSPIHRR